MAHNSFPMKPLQTASGLPVVQNLAVGAASAVATNPVSAQTYAVQLNCTTSAYVVFAPTSGAAVATATTGFLIKNTDYSMIIGIPAGY